MSGELTSIRDLIVHFQNEADRIDREKETILDNRSDIGDRREDVLLDLFKRYLPKRCIPIKGGFVFDSQGGHSKQIDIIITNDITLQFNSSSSNTFAKSFSCIEGCYAVISIKSKLNRTALLEAFGNLSSVPLLKNITFSPLIENSDKVIKQVPLKVIFAFDGDRVENIEAAVQDYLKTTDSQPEKLPDFIIVNKKYYAWKVGPDGIREITTQTLHDYGTYIFEHSYQGVEAMALLHLMTHIQKISNLSSLSIINFDQYLDAAEFSLKGYSQT